MFWFEMSPSRRKLSFPAVKKRIGTPFLSSAAPPDHTPSGTTEFAMGTIASCTGRQRTVSSLTRCPQQMFRQ